MRIAGAHQQQTENNNSDLREQQQPLDREIHRRNLHALYDNHMRAVYQHVHRRCGDHDLAQDVTHDVFMTVATSENDPAEVSIGWLKTVARNRMIDIIRRRETLERKVHLIGADPVPASESGIVNQLLVAEVVEQLNPMHRTVLMLHYVDGYAVSELANLLGRTPKGIEALVTRARAALRAGLEAAGV